MPLLEVCLENEAANLAGAKADQSAHVCDLCREQRGSSFFDRMWLCALCAALHAMALEGERIA